MTHPHPHGRHPWTQGLWHAARVIQVKGVTMTEDEIIERLTDRVIEQLVELGIPWQPGARELLTELRAAAIPSALGRTVADLGGLLETAGTR